MGSVPQGSWVQGQDMVALATPSLSKASESHRQNMRTGSSDAQVLSFYFYLVSCLHCLRQPFGKLCAVHSRMWTKSFPLLCQWKVRGTSWVLCRPLGCASHWSHCTDAWVYQKGRRGFWTELFLHEHSYLGRNFAMTGEKWYYLPLFQQVNSKFISGWALCWEANVLTAFKKGKGWIGGKHSF